MSDSWWDEPANDDAQERRDAGHDHVDFGPDYDPSLDNEPGFLPLQDRLAPAERDHEVPPIEDPWDKYEAPADPTDKYSAPF